MGIMKAMHVAHITNRIGVTNTMGVSMPNNMTHMIGASKVVKVTSGVQCH